MVRDAAAVRAWVEAWRAWSGPGGVVWQERQWPLLGRQCIPARVEFATALDVATFVGERGRWQRASARRSTVAQRWAVPDEGGLGRHFDMLADYGNGDFERLQRLLQWLQSHPRPGLYLPQLPVPGLHAKWVEKRKGLVLDLLLAIRASREPLDFHAACGLRKAEARIRMRVLYPRLRCCLGGLGDLESPVGDLAAPALRPPRVLVVENLDTGLALPDLPQTAVFMKMGQAVALLAQLPWLQGCHAVYWGYIDTHGLAILERARGVLPGLTVVLMDEAMLLEYRCLCGAEDAQPPDAALEHLGPGEQSLFERLKSDPALRGLRLEQESLPWPAAMAALHGALLRSNRPLPELRRSLPWPLVTRRLPWSLSRPGKYRAAGSAASPPRTSACCAPPAPRMPRVQARQTSFTRLLRAGL